VLRLSRWSGGGGLAGLGTELFRQVFEADRDAIGVWDAAAGSLPGCEWRSTPP